MIPTERWSPFGCTANQGGRIGFEPPVQFAYPGELISRAINLNLDPSDLYLAWEIARLAGSALPERRQRALVTLVLALRTAAAEGSTRLALQAGGPLQRILEDLGTTPGERAEVAELLGVLSDHDPAAGFGGGLAEVIGPPGAYRPLIVDHGSLYIQKLHVLESRVAETLRAMIEIPPAETGEAAAAALKEIATGPVFLDQAQGEAVIRALQGRITVISGKPGSGKTSVVASILRVAVRTKNPPLGAIALAAPTGKAADRMRRAVVNHLAAISRPAEADRRLALDCPPSLTLHRLLGYSPGRDRFLHDEHNRLAEQLLIVDESSMIDLPMFDRLLRALGPAAGLVLLGDADQLPPIGAGAVLRDLCRSEKALALKRVTILPGSYRARREDPGGKAILAAAEKIKAGIAPVLSKTMSVSGLAFSGVEHLACEGIETRIPFLECWLERFEAALPGLDEDLAGVYRFGPHGFDPRAAGDLQRLIDHYERYRLLCVTRLAAGGSGSGSINDWFHRHWQEGRPDGGAASGRPRFLVGEPVMVTRNDYNLRLYNGDTGLVLTVQAETGGRRRPPEPMAVFPRGGGFAAYHPGALQGKLEPAWAITVHKAQGSEYDHVALLLPDTPVRPLSRELLYTAITRARKAATLIGPEPVLLAAVARAADRCSGLPDFL